MTKQTSKIRSSLIAFAMLGFSQVANASLVEYFKDEDGHTHWQYVANWSSGILILLLSIAAIVLYLSRKQVSYANRALSAINDELEERVKERTATLDESNKLLKKSNALLEGEIAQHLDTARQLHASESYIKSILESMPVMVCGLSKEGVVTQWNKEAEKITGLKAKDILNHVLWEAYPIMPVSKEKVSEALADNTALHMRKSQRGQQHFEITVYPIEGATKTGVVILLDDVTQQVLSENKLIERDKMSAVGELASVMANDINGPLQRIITDIGKAEKILTNEQNTVQSEDYKDLSLMLKNVSEESNRAAATTANLLNFASSRRDALRLHDITKILDHSIELAENIFSVVGELKFSDIAIVRQYENKLPEIPCFASELQQVFLSLIRHSIYSLRNIDRQNHQPKIIVQTMTSYEALWIKIQHNGSGLSPKEQQAIFEPYFSDESPDFDDYEAGKRLSFSYFIITNHHEGQMAVTSNVDIGTTFHIELRLD